jgi:hypothetical protein
VTASRVKTRLLRYRRSAASRSEGAVGARTVRREARAPAGQPKDSAPSRSAAEKSATLKTPAQLEALAPFALLIVTGTAKTKGLVRAANRAGCRQAAPFKSEECIVGIPSSLNAKRAGKWGSNLCPNLHLTWINPLRVRRHDAEIKIQLARSNS